MVDDVLRGYEQHMSDHRLGDAEFNTLRTGRASILDSRQRQRRLLRHPDASQSACRPVGPEASLIVVQPYDKSTIGDIERAILQSELGLNPNNDGSVIRLPIPQLTEERRVELTKVVGQAAEHGKTRGTQTFAVTATITSRSWRPTRKSPEDDEHRAYKGDPGPDGRVLQAHRRARGAQEPRNPRFLVCRVHRSLNSSWSGRHKVKTIVTRHTSAGPITLSPRPASRMLRNLLAPAGGGFGCAVWVAHAQLPPGHGFGSVFRVRIDDVRHPRFLGQRRNSLRVVREPPTGGREAVRGPKRTTPEGAFAGHPATYVGRPFPAAALLVDAFSFWCSARATGCSGPRSRGVDRWSPSGWRAPGGGIRRRTRGGCGSPSLPSACRWPSWVLGARRPGTSPIT